MPEFDWNNNYRVREQLLRINTDEGWRTVTDWEKSSVTDPAAFLETFTESEGWNDDTDNACHGVDYLRDVMPEAVDNSTVDAFVLYMDKFGSYWRERTVYPGIYDNVERLIDFLKNPDGDNHSPNSPPETVDRDEMIMALKMILCHDQSQRDDAMPEGYCRHGKYVGGCGVDWMCGACEDGAE